MQGNDDGDVDGCRLQLPFFLTYLARSFCVEQSDMGVPLTAAIFGWMLGVPNRVLFPLHGSGVTVGHCPDLAVNGQVLCGEVPDSEQESALCDFPPTVWLGWPVPVTTMFEEPPRLPDEEAE